MAQAGNRTGDLRRRDPALSRAASGWVALSDMPQPEPHPRAVLAAGRFVADLSLPLSAPAVLLDHRDAAGDVFSVFADPQAGLSVLQRQGDRLVRHILPGPLPATGGVARLAYDWSVADACWRLSLTLVHGGEQLGTQGRNPVAPRLSHLHAICRRDTPRHPSLLWCGATEGGAIPDPGPWIGTATPIETARGPVPAGQLRPGERLRTADNGLVPILGIERVVLPSRGSMAPVLLRGAYFGMNEDLLVSPDQPVWYEGPDAEYLFGEDEVLVAARHLVDGQCALWDDRRSLAVGVILDLGMPELLVCGGCRLSSRIAPGQRAPRRLLEGYETIPLTVRLQGGRNAIQRG
ncbi:MAG: hypothetical protein RIR62_838 [Pseudomonadota bacterium]